MEYSKTFISEGVDYSVKMSEEDVRDVLDSLCAFYAKHGVFGESIQQSKNASSDAVNLISKLCDFSFRIMECNESN